ncbi:hypothetical protein C8R43DRAFT_1205421, partial [Mycena crocata]
DATAPVAARLQRRLDSFWSPRSQHTLPLTQDEEPGDTRYVERITPPGPLERRRSVPSCAQLPRPLRPPYTPARPESQHCSGASPDASQRRGAPHLAKRVERHRCAAASARATALCVVPGRTTALQRVARSRKRGAPSPSLVRHWSRLAWRASRGTESRVPCRSNRTGACPASNRAEPRCDEAQSRVVRIEFNWRAPRGSRRKRGMEWRLIETCKQATCGRVEHAIGAVSSRSAGC